jgi:hypothetical protein
MLDDSMIIHSTSIWGILTRFGINLVILIVLIGFVYFRYSRKEKFLFTFFLIGIIVFLVSSIMKKVDIGFGLAFGLFAIFGILRLKTRNFSVKDMAYLFSTIGLAVINALGLLIFPFYGVLILNATIILTAFILEQFLALSNFRKQTVIYDNLDLLKPVNQRELIDDLTNRTGHKITKTRIREIDFKKDTATVEIFYSEENGNIKKKKIEPPSGETQSTTL